MCPSIAAAKKLLRAELNRLQLPYSCLTVRTTGVLDLPENVHLSVTVHGWQANAAAWATVQHFAQARGFRVQRSLALTTCADIAPRAARRLRARMQPAMATPAQANAQHHAPVPAFA